MLNSFDFSQTPQAPLAEPANFVGSASSATTQPVTSSTSQVNNPFWAVGIPGFPVEAMMLGFSVGLLYIVLKRRKSTEH